MRDVDRVGAVGLSGTSSRSKRACLGTGERGRRCEVARARGEWLRRGERRVRWKRARACAGGGEERRVAVRLRLRLPLRGLSWEGDGRGGLRAADR